MSLEVERRVAAVAVLLVGRLLADLCPRRLRTFAVPVDVVDVDVDADRRRAEPLRAPVLAPRLAAEDVPVAEPHLGVPHATLRRLGAQNLLEHERTGQELYRSGAVLVQQIWRDVVGHD